MKVLILFLAACLFFSCDQSSSGSTYHLLDEAPYLDTYHDMEVARLEGMNLLNNKN